MQLNRAVAVGMASGPSAGLALADTLVGEPSLERYHLLPAVRGDLLRKLGRFDEARREFERAASLTQNARERELLRERAAECAGTRRSERRRPIAADELPRATRREWIGLGVIALPCILYSMDLSVLNLAVPALSAELKPSASELLWIVDIYGFLVAGSLITMGTLGDRIGRRRLLMIGAAAFGVASVLAAFSRSSGMLIAARALLGVAGATLAPSTLSLIRNMFHDPKERTFAIAVWITSYSVGRRDRAARRRADAPALPLGLGLPARRAGDGAAARRRAEAASRVPGPGGVAARPDERGPLALERARRDLRPQASSPSTGPGGRRPAAIVAGSALGVVFLRRQRTTRRTRSSTSASFGRPRSARRS